MTKSTTVKSNSTNVKTKTYNDGNFISFRNVLIGFKCNKKVICDSAIIKIIRCFKNRARPYSSYFLSILVIFYFLLNK